MKYKFVYFFFIVLSGCSTVNIYDQVIDGAEIFKVKPSKYRIIHQLSLSDGIEYGCNVRLQQFAYNKVSNWLPSIAIRLTDDQGESLVKLSYSIGSINPTTYVLGVEEFYRGSLVQEITVSTTSKWDGNIELGVIKLVDRLDFLLPSFENHIEEPRNFIYMPSKITLSSLISLELLASGVNGMAICNEASNA